MASRSLSKTLRAPLARQITAVPRVQQRSFAAARSLVRATAVARPAAASFQHQQVRGVKTIDFAGSKEDVYGNCFCRALTARGDAQWLADNVSLQSVPTGPRRSSW